MLLSDTVLGKSYRIIGIDLPSDSRRHLANIGLKEGELLQLVSMTKTGGIIMLKSHRLAFDDSILTRVDVQEVSGSDVRLALSEIAVGSSAYIDNIFATKETKRRLMDMGLTKRTKVYVRKVAPLGDPIELCLRGYELTIRRSEAQLISVIPLEEVR
ncbi:ferrous iron transport protein A [Streptococcus saliviloxodontae]|uniref:Ferrous iron transport protein A n=1 Tax=Streptococcus saliviloxodontae TaxID=1349416 RepID=A0ABS2PIY6_9STRE|nr:FeoA domain-containing protein [Streptococcus saliviloxodontae]MBM7635393.1 ferrous iron transport protein A [Streptococcus saliviloxodontae]